MAWIFFGLGLASFGSVWFVLSKWRREADVRLFEGRAD
jgi:acyl-[acyl-carrier-protein]-phospholipid O-acyltransferase / long-chain-fatty-acid--[acyl-carrier-protein] ligase